MYKLDKAVVSACITDTTHCGLLTGKFMSATQAMISLLTGNPNTDENFTAIFCSFE